MHISFEQYQRYKNAQLIIDLARKDNENFKILEVGANEHKNLEKFLPEDDITYLDINLPEELMDNPKYVLGDATDMEFDDNSYDIVVALDVFEHIPNDRKEMFITELYRVSSKFFVFCAPFDSDEVVAAEKSANMSYKLIFGEDHPWLIEHRQCGLPNFNKTVEFLERKNIKYNFFSHGDINLWDTLISMQFISLLNKELIEYDQLIEEYYNKVVFYNDYGENGYRKFFIGEKANFELYFEKKTLTKEIFEKIYDFKDRFYNFVNFKRDDINFHKITELQKTNDTHKNLYSQVYFKVNGDYSEENSLIKKFGVDYHGGHCSITFEAEKFKNISELRIDPINSQCIVTFDNINVIDEDNNIFIASKCMIGSNASYSFDNKTFIFENDDPNIFLRFNESINIKTINVDIGILITGRTEILSFKSFFYKQCEYKNKIEELNSNCDNLILELKKANSENEAKDTLLTGKDSEIQTIKKELNKNEIKLSDIEIRLGETTSKLNNTKIELEETTSKLNNTKIELEETTSKLNDAVNKLNNTNSELEHFKIYYFAAIDQREELKRQLAESERMYNDINNAFFWKITKPARLISDTFHVFIKKCKNICIFYMEKFKKS